MISIDPKLPVNTQPYLSVVNIKTAIITALQAALDDQSYPDAKIQGINISMEYPEKQENYPTIWVEFSFSKLQQAGIGYSYIDNGQIKETWYFEGQIRLTVISLSSYERDIYSSQLINMLAFSRMNPVSLKFDDVLTSYPNIRLAIDRDALVPEGQSVNPGTPWSDNILTYVDSYSAKMIGEIDSTFTATPEFVRSVHMVGTGDLPGEEVVSETFVGQDNAWL